MAASLNPSLLASSLSYFRPFKRPPSLLPLCFNLGPPTSNPTRISSLRIGHCTMRVPSRAFHLPLAAKLEDVNSEFPSDPEPPSPSEATFDLKLPRRSLLVQFTCNVCGERTERTINRVAYERGTVFVQNISESIEDGYKFIPGQLGLTSLKIQYMLK